MMDLLDGQLLHTPVSRGTWALSGAAATPSSATRSKTSRSRGDRVSRSARASSRITAENTAVLARAALAAQEARNREAAVKKASRSDEAAFTKGAARIYQEMGQP